MATGAFVQTNFTGGEWSKYAQGQTSDPRYKTALTTCLNAYPIEEKAWIRRPGTRHVARARGGVAARTVSLNFTGAAPYNMEFTNGHLRMISGNSLVKETTAYVVSSISTDTPAVLTLATAPGWTSGEIEFSLDDIKATPALSDLAYRQFSITPLTTLTFALHDSVSGAPLDGVGAGWTGGMTLRVSRIADYTTPYTNEEWRVVKSVQSDRKTLLLSGTKVPQVLEALSLPSGAVPATFDLEEFQFKDGPYLDPVSGSVATPDGTIGLVNVSLSFTAYESTRAYKRGDFVSSASIGYRSLQDVNLNNTPASSPTYWEVVSPGQAVGDNGFIASDIGRLLRFKDSASNWTWGRITALSSTGAIDGALAGSVNFGNYTDISRVFDGVASKAYADCAGISFGSGSSPIYGYIGKNYTANGGRAVSTAVVYPSNDLSFTALQYMSTTINLRGSMTSPTGPTDGTLLATSGAPAASSAQGANPVVLVSTDASTVYNYVWVEIQTFTSGDNGSAAVASVQFFGAGAAPAGAGVQVQILGAPLANTSAISTWRLGAYSDTTGWPTCGCYHEGRLFLGGAVENRWDASKSNDITNFEPTAANGVVADNNAISYTFNSSKVNKILWMRSGADGIIFGTQLGEGQIKATQNNLPLSPTNAQAHLITKYGCADIEPVETGTTTVFVQRFRRQMFEYLTDAYSGKFFGHSLSQKAKHLVEYGVSELAYQQERTPIIWARTGDNALRGCTYRRISQFSTQEAELLGWHRHELGSRREIESISVGPSIDGELDALTLVTNDTETGERHIEVATNSFLETDELTSAWFLDNAIVPVSGTLITKIDGKDYCRFKGLWHLNQKRATVFAAGVDCGDFTIENGAVDVPLTGLFTKSRINALTVSGGDFGDRAVSINSGAYTIPCVVGFTYTSRGQLLRPSDSEDSRWGTTGARVGPAFGKARRIHEFAALMQATQAISFGTSFDKLRPAIFKTAGGALIAATELFSGTFNGMVDDNSTTDGMLCWEISRPYPAALLALGGYLMTQDK